MNKKEALRVLQGQIQKLQDEKNQNKYWRTQTFSYLKEIFGEDSHEHHAFSGIDFSTETSLYKSGIIYTAPYDYNLEKFKTFLNNCIETIEVKGIKKNNNWLKQIPNEWLLAIAILLFPAIFTAGTLWGKYLSDTQNIELRQELNALKQKSIDSSLIPPFNKSADTVTANKTKADTTANN